jgi:hypothetical protein
MMMVGLMLTMMLGAQAQTKVTPKMAKGMEKVYVTESKIAIPGQPEVNMTLETKYAVTGETKDGYKMEVLTTDFQSDAKESNVAALMLSAAQKMLKGMTLRLTTDKDGKVKSLDNYDELKVKIDETANNLVEELYKQVPMLSQLMAKDALKNQIMNGVTKEDLLKSMQNTTSPMMLNGKSLMTGMQDEYTNEQGMKMKRMYFVNGKSITTNGSMNMTKDEMKQFLISQVEKLMPGQADMVKENIDQLMNSGMLKIDAKETATYELQDDGWVKTMKVETTYNAMGQETKSTVNIYIK